MGGLTWGFVPAENCLWCATEDIKIEYLVWF